MKTTIEKPTLESLGLICTISPDGVRSMNDGEQPMCAWICTFTNARGRSENFEYFTGPRCGEKYPKYWVEKRFQSSFVVRHIMAGTILDKSILCRLAHEYNLEKKWTPDPIDVLWAIVRDGDALQSTFEDWCGDLGYDVDSRKAEKIYHACQDNVLRLRRLLSAEQIDMIAQLDI